MTNLERIRRDKGVKKAAMCDLLTCTYPTYKKLEDNPEMLTIAQTRLICGFLNCSIEDIFSVASAT